MLAIAIAINTSPVLSQVAPSVTLARETRIDGNTEDLVRIGWVRVAADGRIAFGQEQDKLIRFYDAAGKLIGKFGLAGDGPGEFRSVSSYAGWLGDSLWVFDDRAHRITVIPASLRAPRTAEPNIGGSPSVTTPRIVFGAVRAITRAGDLIIGGLPFGDSTAQLPAWSRDLKTAFVRAKSTGVHDRFLAGVAGVPGRTVSLGKGSAVVPFVGELFAEVAYDGSRVVIVGAAVEGRNAGTFGITTIGGAGDTIFSRRYPFTPEPIPRNVAQEAIEKTVQQLNSLKAFQGYAAQYRAQVRVPPAYPPLASLHVGRDGSICVGMRTSTVTRQYLVFDLRGEPVGQFLLPAKARIGETDLNTLWAIEPDQDGIESLVRYRLTRGAR